MSVGDEGGSALVEKSGRVQEMTIQQCAEGNNVVEITAHTEQEAGMLRKTHSWLLLATGEMQQMYDRW
jgi:hypothetical protein